MIRPIFLQRLSGRVYRKLHRIDREPVVELSEADRRYLEHLYGFGASLGICGLVAMLILALNWRPIC